MSIPDPLETARAALEPGERLVWAGRPDAAVLAWRQFDLKHCLRTAPAAIVAAFLLWQGATGSLSSPFTYLLPLAAFVLLFVALWPFTAPLRALRGARRTVYAVTDQRVFIREAYPRHRLRSFAPDELEEPRWHDRGEGRGDVSFAPVIEMEQTRQGQRSRLRQATFIGITDAPRVAQEIAKLKSRAVARRA